MPQIDGPFVIKNTNERHFTVILDLPNLPHLFPVFHISKLCPSKKNDNSLFSARALIPCKPITMNGQEEFHIKIVDERI
jgi:hypothetical protein